MSSIICKIKSWLPVFILIFILSSFYFSTIAPGITWANNGADGGDFITAAATWGVAHPPGYPFYLTILKIFQLIPINTIAYRSNLLSLVCTISSSVFIYKLAERYSNASSSKIIIGLSTSLVFGLSQLVWSQAVITEVYALQELLLLSFLYLLSFNENSSITSIKYQLLLGVLFGFALQNHLTAVFFLPFLLLIGIVEQKKVIQDQVQSRQSVIVIFSHWHINLKVLFYRCFGTFIGLMYTLTLFLRANSSSPINWGDPTTVKSFLWLITGKMYSGSFFNFSFDQLLTRTHLWGEILKNQLGIVGLIVALVGFVIIGSKSIRKTIFTLWIFLSFFLFSLLYNSTDSFVYIIFSMIAISIWFGWGIDALLSMLRPQKYVGILISAVVVCGIIGFGFRTFPKVDASQDIRAEEFGKKVMSLAPNESIIFTDGDKDSFSLLYYQFILLQRSDISIVVTNLLPYDWYRQSLRTNYPLLHIPDEVINSWKLDILELNPDRPLCNTIVIDEAFISCQK